MKVKNKKVIFLSILIVLLLSLTLFSITHSEELKYTEDSEVAENSDLTYFLEVTYDGIDKKGIDTSTSSTADIKSGYIDVSDPIPEGLIFQGFVESIDGTFGAKDKNGGLCIGSVLDDTGEPKETDTEITYHGLHYNKETRVVSFKVRDLKAGCSLEIGIRTKTPFLGDKKRMDFYNTAFAKEESLAVKSNTIHNWMEKKSAKVYRVSYEFEETSDEELKELTANLLPTDEMKYPADTDLSVLTIPEVEGYKFLGWTTEDATVVNGTFKMPANDVKFIGRFEKIKKYSVEYVIEGEKPTNYQEPSTQQYTPDTIVTLDSLQVGDIVSGYRFLGWNIETTVEMVKEYKDGVQVESKTDFKMPESNVLIKGKFEQVKYKVMFKFIGDIIPPAGDSLLPSTQEYAAGETVKITDIADEEGYHFIGWNYDYEFTMPEHDVIIEGEWQVRNGLFAPTITKEIVDLKEYYRIGDTVLYKITITNNEDYAIRNVQVRENMLGIEFVLSEDYQLRTSKIVEINSIPAHGSVVIQAKYIVSDKDVGTITNEVEIIGALADTNNILDTSKTYKDTAEFKVQSKVTICKNVDKLTDNNMFQFEIAGNNFKTTLNIEGNTCRSLYLDEGSYKVTEIANQEYKLSSVTGAISSNSGTLNIEADKNYEITFNNKLKKQNFFRTFGNVINKIKGGE